MKYSLETKLSVVDAVVNGDHSCTSIARELCVNVSLVKVWVNLYKTHGEEGLIHRGSSFAGGFKLYVVEYMHKQGLSCREAATHFGIRSHSSVAKWERVYYEKGAEGLMKETRGRPPIEKICTAKPKVNEATEKDLIDEIQQLRMENAYLKKLNALVQEKKRSAKKKK